MGQTLCSPGNDLLNRNSLGHLLMADAVLWDGRCVLKGSTCLIDILRGISSWRSLCCGTDAVFPRQASLKWPLGGSMSCGPYAVLWGRRCVLTEWILRIPHALGASPHGGRRVVGRTPCSHGTYSLNGQSLGHLLIVDAVLCDGRCVLKGSIFLIDTPWGISSWRTLCCGTYAVLSREVIFE